MTLPCKFYAIVVGPPGKPIGPLTISDVDKTSAKLTWKQPKEDGGARLTAFIIEKKEGSQRSWSRVDKVGPNDVTYTAKGLKEGTEYMFRVAPENKHGMGEPLEADAATVPKSLFGEKKLMSLSFY